MITPFKSGNKVTQPYGANPDYYKPFGLDGHEGVDIIPIDLNDKTIYIIEDGLVIRDNTFDRAYGIFSVVWNEKNRRAWWYCHMQSEILSLNQVVKSGQKAGIMGGTGNVDGDHLHLGLRLSDAQGNPINMNNGKQGFVNPLPVVQQLNNSYNESMRTIALSAGHYTGDPGASSGNLIERDLTIQITDKAIDMLRKHGVGVLDVPDTIDLAPTIKWINDRAVSNSIELCVEVHINAGGGKGVEAWAYANLSTGVIDPQSQKLGQFLIDAIATESGMSKRGVKPETQYSAGKLGFVHDTIPLASLIECGFIDGTEDKKILGTDTGRTNIAKGVARGILGYMGIIWNPALITPTTPIPVPPTVPPVDPCAEKNIIINQLTSERDNFKKERDELKLKINVANVKIENAKAALNG